MRDNKYFTTNKEEVNQLKNKFKEYKITNNDDENRISELSKERTNYESTIFFVKEIFSEKLWSWNYWVQNYAQKDEQQLLEQPYFGSVNISNLGRVYIGKQSLFNIRTEKMLIHDWRSKFADAYYNRMKSYFLENRYIEILDRRSYFEKYHYNEDDLSLEKVIKNKILDKKTGYLTDIIETIDQTQNEIIRGEFKKVEIILGGPGTGKSTIGLHILSYIVYHNLNRIKKYPKILIVVPNKIFKTYISKVLVDLDLYGKKYHNTLILDNNEFLKNSIIDFDFIFVDECQDMILNDNINWSKYIGVKTIFLCGDENQNIICDKNINWKKSARAITGDENQIRIRTLEKNYRNTKNIIKIINEYLDVKQKQINETYSKVSFCNYIDRIFPDEKFIQVVNNYKNDTVAIITSDDCKETISTCLLKYQIKHGKYEDLLNENNNVFVLSFYESKGLEFNNVIIVNNKINNTLLKKRQIYVGMSRTLNDLVIFTSFYKSNFNKLKDDHKYNFIEPYTLKFLSFYSQYDISPNINSNNKYEIDDLTTSVKLLIDNGYETEIIFKFILKNIILSDDIITSMYMINSTVLLNIISQTNNIKVLESLCKIGLVKYNDYIDIIFNSIDIYDFYGKYFEESVKEILDENNINKYKCLNRFYPNQYLKLLEERNSSLTYEYINFVFENSPVKDNINILLEYNNIKYVEIFKRLYGISNIIKLMNTDELTKLYNKKLINNEDVIVFVKDILTNEGKEKLNKIMPILCTSLLYELKLLKNEYYRTILRYINENRDMFNINELVDEKILYELVEKNVLLNKYYYKKFSYLYVFKCEEILKKYLINNIDKELYNMIIDDYIRSKKNIKSFIFRIKYKKYLSRE